MKFLIMVLLLSLSVSSQIDTVDSTLVLDSLIIDSIDNIIPYNYLIKEYSRKYLLEFDLICGIIKTESNYNFLARSKKRAIGLMQVVAKSAGAEVWEYWHGYKNIPKDSILYIPTCNIDYGCAYLYLLKNYYFLNIEDSLSRMYCMIAAYNTGPSNLTKAFVTKNDIIKRCSLKEFERLSRIERLKIKLDITINKINSMESKKVKKILELRLPYKQTRLYLNKVLKNMNLYKSNT